MTDNTKTQGDLLQEYMDAKSMSADALAEKLQEAAQAVLENVDRKRVNRWLMNKEAIPATLIPGIKGALELNGDQTYDLRQAVKNFGQQQEAAAAPQEHSASETIDAQVKRWRSRIPMFGVDAAFDHREPVQQDAAAQPAALDAMTEEKAKELVKASADAFSELLKLTPKLPSESRGITDDGKARVSHIDHALPIHLEKRKGMKLTRAGLSRRAGHRGSTPSEAFSASEVEMLINVMSQSVDESDKEFNKAANRFRRAVEAAEPAWQFLSEQKETNHAERAARKADRKQER